LGLKASLCNRTTGNCHYIKPAGTFADVTFCQKSLGRANHHVLFFPRNAQFRQCRHVLPDGARSDFHKGQRLAIIADEIDSPLIPRGV
jgi:hypothetical protein